MDHQHLLLLPHPLSHAKIRRLTHNVDGEIIGQVTGAAICLTDADNSPARLAARKKI
jgi:hypothetical protein